MNDQPAQQLLARLRGLSPLSPAFGRMRDDLAELGAAESARLMRVLGSVGFAPIGSDGFARILRRVEQWTTQLGGPDASAATGQPARPAVKRWFWQRPAPAPEHARPDPAEITSTLAELAALQDAITFQLVTAERMAGGLEQAEHDLSQATARLKALRSAVQTEWPGSSAEALDGAVNQEIVPALTQREGTLLIQFALSRQARLALATIHAGNRQMAEAVRQTLKVVRLLGSTVHSAERTDRDIAASEREMTPWLEALAAIGEEPAASGNLIEPTTPGGADAQRLRTIRGALAAVENSFARINQAHRQLSEVEAAGRLPPAE